MSLSAQIKQIYPNIIFAGPFPGNYDCRIKKVGTVESIAEWKSTILAYPTVQQLADAQAALDGVVIAPQFPTLRQTQFRLWLLSAGIKDQDVRNLIATLPTELAQQQATIMYDYSDEIHRNHPLVIQLGTALGLSSTQLDDAFNAASKL
jgi:hypothetical protein